MLRWKFGLFHALETGMDRGTPETITLQVRRLSPTSTARLNAPPSAFRFLRQPYILGIILAVIVVVAVTAMLMIRQRRIGPVTVEDDGTSRHSYEYSKRVFDMCHRGNHGGLSDYWTGCW